MNILMVASENDALPGGKVGGIGSIYCDDPSNRPFATDATKFALFCSAVCQAIVEKHFGTLDVLDLHDWHAAIVAMLLAYHHSVRFYRVFVRFSQYITLPCRAYAPLQEMILHYRHGSQILHMTTG